MTSFAKGRYEILRLPNLTMWIRQSKAKAWVVSSPVAETGSWDMECYCCGGEVTWASDCGVTTKILPCLPQWAAWVLELVSCGEAELWSCPEWEGQWAKPIYLYPTLLSAAFLRVAFMCLWIGQQIPALVCAYKSNGSSETLGILELIGGRSLTHLLQRQNLGSILM